VPRPASEREDQGRGALTIGEPRRSVFTLVVVMKALVEVALFALVGQGIVGLFAGSHRRDNFVYRLLETVASPVLRVARIVSPRFVIDAHLPVVAFMLLVFAWVGLFAAKVYLARFTGAQ